MEDALGTSMPSMRSFRPHPDAEHKVLLAPPLERLTGTERSAASASWQ
jgi:hypothetical protein